MSEIKKDVKPRRATAKKSIFKKLTREKCRFLYFHAIENSNFKEYISAFEGNVGLANVSKYGGISVCSFLHGETVYFTAAFCNKSDLFLKSEGRRLSLERMNNEEEMCHVTIPDNVDFDSQTIRDFIVATLNNMFRKFHVEKHIVSLIS